MSYTDRKDEYAVVLTNEDADHESVRILDGVYAGITYCYGRVGIEETPDGFARLTFTFDIEEIPNGSDIESLKNDPNFINYIGEVLHHIIDEASNNSQFGIGEKNVNSNSST